MKRKVTAAEHEVLRQRVRAVLDEQPPGPIKFPAEPITWDRGFLRRIQTGIEYQCRRCKKFYMGNDGHRCGDVP